MEPDVTIPSHDWLCQQIVEGAPDAIIFVDSDGVIRLWNAGAEAMFGHGAAEATGQTLDLIIPERLRERHWEGYRTVMSSGVTKYAEGLLAVPAVTKDGARISIEFTISLLKDTTGVPLGAAAVIRNVTERRAGERETQERIAQLETQVAAGGPPAEPK